MAVAEDSITIGPDEGDKFQSYINRYAPTASVANPFTIVMRPGVYTSDFSPTIPAGTLGLNLIGAGRGATILRPSAAWYNNLGNGVSTVSDFLVLNNLTSSILRGFTVDLLTNDPLTWGFATNKALGAIAWAVGNSLFLEHLHTRGIGYGFRVSGSGGIGTDRVFSFGNLFEARSVALSIGPEHWFGHGTVVNGENDTTAYYGTQTQVSTPDGIASKVITGLLMGELVTTGSSHWAGCYFNSVDRRTGAATGGSSASVTYRRNASTNWDHFTGCTFNATSRQVSPDDNAGVNNHTAVFDIPNAATVAGRVSFDGGLFGYESATATQGYYTGGIVCDSPNASGLTISLNGVRIESLGGTLNPAAANGIQGLRGDVVYVPNTGTPPTIKVLATQMTNFPTAPIATPGWNRGEDWSQTKGTATLASGTATVLLITNGGALGGSPTFAANGTSVTGGTNFNSVFVPGYFIKKTGDPDTAWTRITSIQSGTNLTLETGGYRGTGGAGASSGGSPNTQTQPDTSYAVAITSTSVTGETFAVSNKHATGFVITSSNAASTATVDWQLQR